MEGDPRSCLYLATPKHHFFYTTKALFIYPKKRTSVVALSLLQIKKKKREQVMMAQDLTAGVMGSDESHDKTGKQHM